MASDPVIQTLYGGMSDEFDQRFTNFEALQYASHISPLQSRLLFSAMMSGIDTDILGNAWESQIHFSFGRPRASKSSLWPISRIIDADIHQAGFSRL